VGDEMTRKRTAREIETIVHLSSIINSSLDITEVLDNSMRLAEELMDAEVCSIFEVDHEKNELFFRLARRDPRRKTQAVRMKMGEGIAGWVASSGEPLVVPDTEKDDRFSGKVDSLTGFRTRSIIALPIKHREQILGVLEVLNKRGPDAFDSEDLEVLAIVANQIGIAIQNAKLYARLRQQFTLTEAELKETQARLLRSERLAALGQLSQGIAHEVRNPVTSIGGFAKRLKKALPEDDPVVHYVDIILKETSRLEQMVQDLEQFTRMPKPEIRQVKLLALLQSALKVWGMEDRSDHIEVNMETLPEDPAVFVDRALMEQALIHLLRNARDAMPQGGVISISTSWEDKWLVLSVKDTGSGIASEELPRIFDPFFTSKTRGSGLGLTTVNRIVNEHGGEVEIFSTPGDGTEARILLPPFSQPHLT